MRTVLKVVAYVIASAVLIILAIDQTIAQRESAVRRKGTETRAVFDEVRTATVSYGVDRCGVFMPPDTLGVTTSSAGTTGLTLLTDNAWMQRQLTEAGYSSTHWHALTTPVAYLGRIPHDPFAPRNPIGYIAPPFARDGGLPFLAAVRSVGPNGTEDVDLGLFRERLLPLVEHRSLSMAEPLPDEMGPYVAAMIEELLPNIYDPTNGTFSHGDLIRVFDTQRVLFDSQWTSDPQLWRISAEGVAPDFSLDHIEAVSRPITGALAATTNWEGRTFLAPLFEMETEELTTLIESNRGRLGEFAHALQTPRPLDPTEALGVMEWSQDNADWWRLIGEIREGPLTMPREITASLTMSDRENVVAAIPMVLRSIALSAMDDMAAEHTEKAEQARLALVHLASDPLLAGDDPILNRAREEAYRLAAGIATDR